MKRTGLILVFILSFVTGLTAQEQTPPDFTFGDSYYFNLNVDETISFRNTEVKLLQQENHYNLFKIGNDTVWLKVSRRTLPRVLNGIRIFVADNRNIKAIAGNSEIHSLLKKDALICLTDLNKPLLNPNKYIFPISFNDGFMWSAEEDSHMFSYQSSSYNGYKSHGGIDIDLHDARGLEKHWIVAIEDSRVVWVKEKNNRKSKEACVLLESETQSGIYYLYDHLNQRKVEVKEGKRLMRGEPIGNIWGDDLWGHLHFSVIKCDSVPDFDSKYLAAVNFFPQLYELYFKEIYSYNKSFSRGIIKFGQRRDIHGNRKNISAFESYTGKGWQLGRWNTADRVEYSTKGEEGNARLKKTLFSEHDFSFKNPTNYYDYEITVPMGVYRIRAKMGDWFQPSWQKVLFENIQAADYSLNAGEFKWTSEKVVKVRDGKLTVRIFVDESNKKPAGISEIVFQRAY